MATQYDEYEYEILEKTSGLVKKTRALDRIGILLGEATSAELEEIMTMAFFAQLDTMIPTMKRIIVLREEMKVEELKDSLSEEDE